MPLEPNRFPEDVFWEVCGTIFTRERPGAINIDFTKALAIPVAEDAVWRHRAALEGAAVFCPPEATECSQLWCFAVFVNLMILDALLSVSVTLQCVPKRDPSWDPWGYSY